MLHVPERLVSILQCCMCPLACIIEALRFATGLVYIVLWFLGVFLWVAIGEAQCQSERLLLIPAILSWVCWFLSSCVSLGCDWHASNLIFNHILGLSLDLKSEKAAEAEVERVMVWMGMIVCTHVEPQADPPPPQAPVDGKYRSTEVKEVEEHVDEHVECGLPPGWRQKQVCMTPWRLFRARFA